MIKKIKWWLNHLIDISKKNIKTIKFFGFKLFFFQKSSKKIYKLNRSIGLKLYEKRYSLTKKIIKEKYAFLLCKNYKFDVKNIDEKCPVWICWWQGEENAPEMIRRCIDSVKKNCRNHEVIVITSKNYFNYVDVPEQIMSKIKNGKLSLTHLSDLIRLKLLGKYGGIWCDATIFMSNKLDINMYNYAFYTIKHDFRYILSLEVEPSKCKWRVFFMASGIGNDYFLILADVFSEWLKGDLPLIDYFTLDYLIWIMSEESRSFKEIIERVPKNNNGPYRLAKVLNNKFDQQIWENISEENYLHKLNYRIQIEHNDDTFYEKIVNANQYD